MKYTSFYNHIKNPLDDKHVIDGLIEAYSKDKGLYSSLTKVNSKNKKLKYNVAQCNDLHAFLFNTWKKELLSLTHEQYETAIRNGLYDRSIYKLIAFLKTVPDVTTKTDAMKIMDASFKDKELSDAMEKYRWDSIGLYSSWTHIKARYIHGKKPRELPLEHRLYINAELTDVHALSKIFIEKCISRRLPYYFKIAEASRRDDDFVIYTDTKHLPNHLEILKEIEKEHPELVSRCGEPPILSGKVRNWIGYGSEPLELSGKTSFNEVRAQSIEKAIEKELISWYKKNIKSDIIIQGKRISLVDYLCQNVTLNEIKSMQATLERNPNSKYIKYTRNDITNPQFTTRLERTIKANAQTIINSFLTGKKSSLKMEVPIKEGCTKKVYSSSIISELKKFILTISANDSEFVKRIKERIIKDAKNHGIDPYKYCFDKKNVELLVNAELASEGNKVSSAQQTKPQQSAQHQATPIQQSEHQTKKDSSVVYYRPPGPQHFTNQCQMKKLLLLEENLLNVLQLK